MFKWSAAKKTAFRETSSLLRLKAAVARGVLMAQCRRFRCRVEQYTSGQTGADDQAFRVQMIGRIATPEDDWPTDVRVEIIDLTDGTARAEPVLSADPAYQSEQGAFFLFQRTNGRVPKRNAVLARWVTVAEIPCDVLRFACRGRRRLMFSVSVLCGKTGQVLSGASCKADYVSCRDGYRQQQQRRLEVLQSTLTIAAAACAEQGRIAPDAAPFLRQWLSQAVQTFPPAERLEPWLANIAGHTADCNVDLAADRLLAWGQPSDKEAAVELALQSAACCRFVSDSRMRQLIELARGLDVAEERFLEAAQKTFLGAGCAMENTSVLAGIEPSMCREEILKRLNDEYRKWNARVTHPSAEVRQLADKMLSLIADLRSSRFSASPCSR